MINRVDREDKKKLSQQGVGWGSCLSKQTATCRFRPAALQPPQQFVFFERGHRRNCLNIGNGFLGQGWNLIRLGLNFSIPQRYLGPLGSVGVFLEYSPGRHFCGSRFFFFLCQAKIVGLHWEDIMGGTTGMDGHYYRVLTWDCMFLQRNIWRHC
jgi:hypothetical protein